VFAVTANRTGEESRAGRRARFTGASQITGPKADVVARAGASGQRAMVVEVDLGPVRTKRLTSRDTALSVRRPETYGPLVKK
jgi:predicted amidohydrolase